MVIRREPREARLHRLFEKGEMRGEYIVIVSVKT